MIRNSLLCSVHGVEKNGTLILILLLISFLLPSQTLPTNNIHNSIPKKIVIASEPDYPPYCIVGKNGNADGFSVDLMKESAKAVGLNLEIRIGVWNKIKEDLALGKIDALPIVGRTPERENLFDFTLPYLTLHGAIFVREGTTDIHSTDDLKNKSIVVMKGDNAEEFIRRVKLSNHILTTNTFAEAFTLLAKGEYDAVIIQRVTGLKLLENIGIKSIIPLDILLPGFKQEFCFAVKKGNSQLLSQLNEGLSIVIANKKYNEIHLKWFGPDTNGKVSLKEILIYTAYIIIPVLILISILFIYSLRRQIKIKTLSLNEEIAERKIIEQSLKDKNEELDRYFNNSLDLLCIANTYGEFIRLNPEWEKVLGYSLTDLEGKRFLDFIHPDDLDKTIQVISKLEEQEQVLNFENRYLCKDGSYRWIEWRSKPIGTNIYAVARDITARKMSELQNELYRNILELYHNHELSKSLIYDIIQSIRAYSGCEAIGIRLKEGEDYPYYEASGFIDGHVKYENRLCALDQKGEIIRDSDGNPILECMCGNILCGRFNPSFPFFSERGSFWTNSTTKLLASTTEEDRQSHTRNRCNGEGYESVALIPIKGEDGNIGLLQLNDFKPNRFTPELISFYEYITQAIGITLIGKRAEEELKEKNKFIQTVLDNLPIGVALNQINEGNAFYFNKQFEKIYGWPSDEIRDINIFFEKVYPDEGYRTELISRIMADIQSGDTSKMHWEDCIVTHKDGSKHFVNAVNIPLLEQNTMVSTVYDVSVIKENEKALRQSEEKFRSIFENHSAIKLLIDPNNGKITDANQAASEYYGWSLDELKEMSIQEISAFESEETILTMQQVKDGEQTHSIRTHRLKNGSIRNVEVFSSSIMIGSKNYLHSIIHDITDKVAAENELTKYRDHLEVLVEQRTEEIDIINQELKKEIELKKQAEMKLEEALDIEMELNKLKSRFISTASHEFRTPLTSILMSVGLIQRFYDKWDKSKITDHFQSITKSIKNLTKLLDDVLSVNRAESGRSEFKPLEINLRDLCHNSIGEAQKLAKQNHNVILTYNIEQEVFMLDPALIEFILNNLLSNAIKYSPDGGKVELRVILDNRKINITVSDEGIGIPPEDIPKLYENFHRAQNATDIQGTGLGLSIVKNAVDLHNGNIIVSSILNVGTTFIVTIPICN